MNFVLPGWVGACDTARAVLSKEVTAAELVSFYAAQIERRDPDIKAWAYFNGDQALRQADEVDRKILAGDPIGGLAGIPVGVKDVFNTCDMPTCMGSPIWQEFDPGNDARVVYYLRQADAVIMGKTVTAEFAVHTPGPTRNPHDLRYSPGTSSSGSAAAVASGMVPLALGTQTAGSIIRPASYCGIYGFKPSFGLVPRTGVLKTTDTLDTIGMFARTVDDLELLFDVIRVQGRDFPISERMLVERSRKKPITRSWRIALVRGPKWEYAEPYAKEALFNLGRQISKDNSRYVVEEAILPSEFEQAHAVHSVIYDRTLAYYFREEFKQHTLVSPKMYEIIDRGNAITLEDYKVALRQQRTLSESLDKFFEQYDAILDLSTGGEALIGLDSVDRPDNCLIWTMCSVPAVSIPMFRGPNVLPYGLQVVGRRYSDYMILQLCRDLGGICESQSLALSM